MIDEHPGPLTYDLLTRTNYRLCDLGVALPWDESVWLVEELLQDPSAHVTAAILNWGYPVSQEWKVLADLRDIAAMTASPKNKPSGRPWDAGARRRKPEPVGPELKLILQANAGRGVDDGG